MQGTTSSRKIVGRALALGVVGLLLAVGPARLAGADTTVCTPITSLPFTVSQSGVYCLDRNLSAGAGTAFAVRVQADDVTIDLNGYTLAGSGTPGATTLGITADGVPRRNVTVRNGTVRGFIVGVWLGPGEGQFVERIVAEGNTQVGIYAGGRGAVRGCEVSRTGGSTALPFGAGIYGILAAGQGSSIVDNTVVDTGSDADGVPAYGIYVLAGRRSFIERNRVGQSTPYSQPNRKGIYLNGAESTSVVGNRLTNLSVGIEYGPGGSSGPYRDNICTACATTYVGGTNAGNNF